MQNISEGSQMEKGGPVPLGLEGGGGTVSSGRLKDPSVLDRRRKDE